MILAANAGYGFLAEALLGLIAALCGIILQRVTVLLKKRTAKMVPVETVTAQDLKIQELLGHLCDRLGALRAYLSRYHNGDHYVDNCEMQKKTRTHEAVRDGVAYQAEQFRGMLVSSIVDETNLVIEKGHSFTLVRDLPKGKFKWLCISGGVHSVARCAVRKDGELVGFVGLDFDHETCPPEIDVLCEFAGRIETLL